MKKFGVLGFPVKHSLSPKMHNAGLNDAEFDGFYEFCEVAPDDLNCFMKRVKTGEFAGLSVTVPYKEAILEYCDKLSLEAEIIGAVNTLYFEDGFLVGDNTDWIGFITALKEVESDFEGLRFLILGAGGSAKACLFALNKEGVSPMIYNRTRLKAVELGEVFKCEVVDNLDVEADVIVNCTSVGLKVDDELLVPLDLIKRAKIVYDLVYLETPLVKVARENGLKVVDAKRMLLWQGARQFKFFTGVNPSVEVMWKSLKN